MPFAKTTVCGNRGPRADAIAGGDRLAKRGKCWKLFSRDPERNGSPLRPRRPTSLAPVGKTSAKQEKANG